ncbi:MAG TPA: methyltransferase domain-containing protein [Steroidobacteraceae bacterium]|nr:methyltransferase domain-containing protein [Steroidobacteraceae bacterium]
MEARLQRRIQRYGWDRAAEDYEPLWQEQLAIAQAKLLDSARLKSGQRVVDIACGTGLVTRGAALAVGPSGHVVGVDISEQMIETARLRAAAQGFSNVIFARMGAENLALPDASFDVALCALGLMYVPDPLLAIREMQRVVRPGGRVVFAVWGERAKCGWSPVFPIVEAQVQSDVCPLFFQLGQQDNLARLCVEAQLGNIEQHRIQTTLDYADIEEACDAAFVGGPVALAWSRFDGEIRARVRRHYAEAINPWRVGQGYRVPGEFVIVAGTRAA